MKPFTLLLAALLAGPALADDLCTLNLEKIDSNMATLVTLGEPLKGQVEEHQMKAEEAHKAGDTEGCILHSTKALQLLEAPGENGGSRN